VLPSAQGKSVCSLCNGTGWKSLLDGEVERVARCDCWRDDINKRLIVEARMISSPTTTTPSTMRSFARGSSRRSFPSSNAGCFSSAIPAWGKRI